MAQGSADRKTTQSSTALDRSRTSPWRHFDEMARSEFCEAIQNGVKTRPMAVALLGLNPAVVERWIQLGRNKDAPEEDYPYRLFYLQLKSAEAKRDAAKDLVMHQAMVGATVEAMNKDGEVVLLKQPGDWRAAAEIGKREERMEALAMAREKHKVAMERERAEAKIAQVKAEILERGLRRVNGRLFWPIDIAQRMTQDERLALEGLMLREGLIPAEPAEAEREAAQRDPLEDEHIRRLAEQWGLAEERDRAIDADAGPIDEAP